MKPILERCFNFIVRFWHFPKPTISAVNGYALAGGCELALCCDMTIMAEGAYLGEPELRFGSGIVALIMPWLIGPKKAKEWILTGEDRIDAKQALDIISVMAFREDGKIASMRAFWSFDAMRPATPED